MTTATDPPIAHLHPETGFLPPGLHPADAALLRAQFVDGMNASTDRRRTLMAGYDQLVEALQMVAIPAEQWIGGSFTSSAPEPQDIDVVNFCDARAMEALPSELISLIAVYFRGKETVRRCHCDSYCVPKAPPDHPAHGLFEVLRAYWTDQFGYDIAGRPRGMVQVTIDAPEAGPNPDESPTA